MWHASTVTVEKSGNVDFYDAELRRHNVHFRAATDVRLGYHVLDIGCGQAEPGIVDVCELLHSRGVGIEAGLLCHRDAEQFVRSDVPEYALRVLIEPLDADPRTACEHAEVMELILAANAVELHQMHHSDGVASWAVNERTLERGHDVRTGIEDTCNSPTVPDAADNAELISTLAVMIERIGHSVVHPKT